MKIKNLILIASFLGVVLAGRAQGTAFTYQGRLNNGSGPANGSHDLVFAVYDTNAPAGNLVAGPVTNTAVAVSNGLFLVTLDFGAGVFTGNPRWLEIAVRTNGGSTFVTLAPRQRLTPTPYAIMANSASNLLGTLPAAQLSGPIPASLISGVIPSADITGTYGNAVSFNNGADTFDGTFIGQFFGSSFTGGIFTGNFVGNGAGLYGLTDSQLPGNVAFLNSNQVFTAQNVFAQGIGIGTANPSPLYQIDALAGQSDIRLQTTNDPNGAVLELRNTYTNQFLEYMGAINFNDYYNSYPGQIGYFRYPEIPGDDYLSIRINGLDNSFRLIGDTSGEGTPTLLNGAYNSAPYGFSGNVVAGGGSSAFPNGIFYGQDDFIGSGAGNQIADYGIAASYSFIGGGYTNRILSDFSFIGGGQQNSIQGNSSFSAIVGGIDNSIQTNSPYSFIAGGVQNIIQNNTPYSFVGGGNNNVIQPGAGASFIGGGNASVIQSNADHSVIGGGWVNQIQVYAWESVISGGELNLIGTGAQWAAIGGGEFNNNNSQFAFIGGGSLNTIQTSDYHAMIGGGAINTIQYGAHDSVIDGGYGNTVQFQAINGVIGGGYTNTILNNAQFSTIGGGVSNNVAGSGGTVPGGYGNSANGFDSLAAGTFAQATNDGAFVLTDSGLTNFYSTASNQLSARFTGGIRFVTGGAGITLDGQPMVSGNYSGPLFLTNISNFFGGNGGGLTNVNATWLNGLPSTSYAPASGSPNYIDNQNLGFQNASFQISGSATVSGAVSGGVLIGTNAIINNTITTSNLMAGGLIRSGSEAGTGNPPSPAGLVIRRVNSLATTVGNVIARSDVLTLERDGSNEGLLIRYPAGVTAQTINGYALTETGANIVIHNFVNNPATTGTLQLVTSAQRAVHLQLSFGNTRLAGHVTQVVIDRYDDGSTDDNYWVGTVISTYNQ